MKRDSISTRTFPPILIVVLALFALLLFAPSVHAAIAEYDDFSVHIAMPYEGETLYAGPSSLIYRVPVSGWVISEESDPSQIVVHLEIFKGSQLIGEEQQNLHPEGTFSFSITVNPKSSLLSFTATQEWCATACHSPGDIQLQAGELILRVTAITPDGDQASAQHLIIVEHSDYAILPVQVVRSDGSGEGLEGVRVSASTWLYLWRARSTTGLTDKNGYVELQVEALTSESTTYSILIEPSTIDGVLYTGGKTVEVTIPPGAKTAAPLSIEILSSTGHLSGTILGMEVPLDEPIPVAAIQLPYGEVHRTYAESDGSFSFLQLPIGQYLVTVDNDRLDEPFLKTSSQETDLRISSTGSVYLPVQSRESLSVNGTLQDEKGNPIPFAWITLEDTNNVLKVLPIDGSFDFEGVTSEPQQIRMDAPGFYSQYYDLDSSPDPKSNLNLTLKTQIDSLSIPWGNGAVILPPESNAATSEGVISLLHGWLWGRNSTGGHLMIRTPTVDIQLFQADFSLEYLRDESAWLYVFSGQADVRDEFDARSVAIHEGQMLNLLSMEELRPVPIDSLVVKTLQSNNPFSISSVWEPTRGDKFESWVKEASIKAVQILTITVYAIILISIVVVPLITIARWWRAKSSKESS